MAVDRHSSEARAPAHTRRPADFRQPEKVGADTHQYEALALGAQVDLVEAETRSSDLGTADVGSSLAGEARPSDVEWTRSTREVDDQSSETVRLTGDGESDVYMAVDHELAPHADLAMQSAARGWVVVTSCREVAVVSASATTMVVTACSEPAGWPWSLAQDDHDGACKVDDGLLWAMG